ncbi:flagellar motor stator protein MotA [Sansalvadorimonas sp. 2012CJ34-2]|uniref:Flagellar motor stator protein MotA n=1 Tax=Parendozoicomonas callyspongiae TaxID=2942213 RepID=A0ABT0PDY2_9GAMM|nr:flagellar motor stator protein MotA [Sansalvadorimonas sp. 2012CJ34-2]MCL6269565.1 flagellar motor stator protein MotA [Sansalvadorimonas sp. 2012CJ34-2]
MLRIVGFFVLFASVIGGFVAASGKVLALWQPAELVVIAGAALGSFMVANPKSVQQQVMVHMKFAFFKKYDFDRAFYMDLLRLVYQLLELSRKEGGNALEEHIESPENSGIFEAYPKIAGHRRLLHYVTDNFRVTSLGNVSSHDLENLMEQEVHTFGNDLKRSSKALQDIADACPGFGIIAAVLGIIITMQSIDGPVELIGVKVAAALTGTFFGILLCYGVLGPLATAIDHTAKCEIQAFEFVKATLVASVSGRPPLMAVDAGRRVLLDEIRPTFFEMEESLRGDR